MEHRPGQLHSNADGLSRLPTRMYQLRTGETVGKAVSEVGKAVSEGRFGV